MEISNDNVATITLIRSDEPRKDFTYRAVFMYGGEIRSMAVPYSTTVQDLFNGFEVCFGAIASLHGEKCKVNLISKT